MQTFNPVLKRGVLCLGVTRLDTVKIKLDHTINTMKAIQYLTQREADHSYQQGRIAACKLIPIKFANTNNSTLQHTLTIH